MTGTERLVARALADHRANLDGALRAIRDYQAALTALEDLAMSGTEVDWTTSEWAKTRAGELEAIWRALDVARWLVPPWPGTRDT